mgnify:CR=1 FL=1
MSAEFKKYCCQNKLTADPGEGARLARVNPAQPNKAITNENKIVLCPTVVLGLLLTPPLSGDRIIAIFITQIHNQR